MKKTQIKGIKTDVKAKPGAKRRGNKRVVVFDDKERQDFLTGFHKRKVERRKAAVKEMKTKLKEEQNRVREERHKEYLKILKERRGALEEANELEDAMTATTQSVQYNHPNHTVTVTTISNLDLTSAQLLQPLTSQEVEESENEEKCDEKGKVEALTKKAGNPLLSKKIKSLSASLNAFTKQKQRRKGKKYVRGHRSQDERNSSKSMGNKCRLGRTTKKQRRRRTGRKGQSQD
ncbi:hypothetical protein NFI96_018931 [Prochilodus magdalenae]|nr:hypothetical protein NFI96_018931 [Prochilodus magdalenae]